MCEKLVPNNAGEAEVYVIDMREEYRSAHVQLREEHDVLRIDENASANSQQIPASKEADGVIKNAIQVQENQNVVDESDKKKGVTE